jgi:hypothetical protein
MLEMTVEMEDILLDSGQHIGREHVDRKSKN